MNNDLGMMKSLMATNLQIENPEKFIQGASKYEYDKQLSKLNSRKLFT